MNRLANCIPLVFLLIILGCKQKKTERSITKMNCDSLNTEAAKLYSKSNAALCIEKFKLVADCYSSAKDSSKAGYAYLNAGTAYEEFLGETAKATEMLEKSLSIKRDSFHKANVLKIYGLYLGKMGKYDRGIDSIEQSKEIFRTLGKEFGVAVADFDAAQVYYLQEDYESASAALNKSYAYWRNQGNEKRIFVLNNFAILLSTAMGNQSATHGIIRENDSLMRIADIPQSGIDTFMVLKEK